MSLANRGVRASAACRAWARAPCLGLLTVLKLRGLTLITNVGATELFKRLGGRLKVCDLRGCARLSAPTAQSLASGTLEEADLGGWPLLEDAGLGALLAPTRSRSAASASAAVA